MPFLSKNLNGQLLFIAAVHLLAIALIVAAPYIGLGNDEGFFLFVRYQLTRTDCLILVIVSGVFFGGIAALRDSIGTLAFIIWTATIICGLYTFDYFIAYRPGDMIHFGGDSKTNIYTLDLYPYTGWHIQPNFHYVGDLPEDKAYHDYDIQSGDMGYFIDFPLKNPPAKKSGEFRIILIGGSGAHGFGARTNEDMFYRKLEKDLNERKTQDGLTFKVINLSMAGSNTYQNFIALNRFAHPLQPDMILSYSGANDFSGPALHEQRTDGFFDFTKLKKYAISTRPSEYPPLLRPFATAFPHIFNYTHFGIALKQLFPSYFLHRAQEVYKDNRDMHYDQTQPFLDEYAVPFYVDSLKSIKRDFDGIPIMIAWQIMQTEADVGFKHPYIKGPLRPDFYNDMFRQAEKSLRGYRNDSWIFFNANNAVDKIQKIDFNTHLSNKGHTVLASLLADKILANASLLNNFNIAK